MKIFSQDHSWRGVGVVVAPDENAARTYLLHADENYEYDKPLEQHEIKEGVTVVNMGDS